jgi:ATP-binding cassette, subfamily F, member 3
LSKNFKQLREQPIRTSLIYLYNLFVEMPRKGKEAAGSSLNTGIASSQLTITAQQSRYYADAIDAPVSKEIFVKDLCIAIGQRDLLSHTQLHLVEGRHYVLVGKNGTGKSSMHAKI